MTTMNIQRLPESNFTKFKRIHRKAGLFGSAAVRGHPRFECPTFYSAIRSTVQFILSHILLLSDM